MQTIKLPYKTNSLDDTSLILDYQKQYSNCLHIFYNRVKDKMSETNIKHLELNNLNLLDSWFKQSCVKEASQLNSVCKNSKLIFGGKSSFIKLIKKQITKEEFNIKRLSSIYSIGEGANPNVKGNRKFAITQDLTSIIFKPNVKTKIELILPKLSQNYLNILTKLYLLQESKQTSITYKLDQNFIYIIFNEKVLCNNEDNVKIKNRLLGIDLNPNYIGWSIIDWISENEFNVIDKGVYSLKQLNDIDKTFKDLKLPSNDSKRIKLSNKRKFETLQISKELLDKATHYKVEIFAVEDLNIKSSDKGNGTQYNKLCNNIWLRSIFSSNIEKRCNIFNIKFLKVKPEYSSFIGNILYRNLNLPDMILSSIEISRRAYEFNLQYISKTKSKKKNIILPDINLFKNHLEKSLEEFNLKIEGKCLKQIYYLLKNSKVKYRVPLDHWSRVLSLKHIKSNINCYQFI